VAGIIANLHDVVIILGFFAFFQWEFSLSVLAGVLAVLGYSVNESVVIFDRIREAFRKFRKLTPHEVIDHGITSTMSRTVITHASTEAMVLSMFFFGGQSLHYSALALTIGILLVSTRPCSLRRPLPCGWASSAKTSPRCMCARMAIPTIRMPVPWSDA